MALHDKISTGMQGFDQVIDKLRLGDNVVWQVNSIEDYKTVVQPYVRQTIADGRKLIYVRFGIHESLIEDQDRVKVYHVDAAEGFEYFATYIRQLIEDEGKRAFYVFDSLTDLLEYWHSDLMISNFFKVTCPFLYELDTIAYFALIRNAHTYDTIAEIRETTQLLLDLYSVNQQLYIHPLKAWLRYSPTMFLPHLIRGQEAICVTASAEAASLFASISRSGERLDYWNVIFEKAKDVLLLGHEEQEATKRKLMEMLVGKGTRIFHLCDTYFSLSDILMIADREVGTGFIGGKSVGMLLARKILEKQSGIPATYWEPHDSFYLGSDIFYTFIVRNGLWQLRTKQKTEEGYFACAGELQQKILDGVFPEKIQEQFMQMLEYFGQSPIIVRSSSLLEDNFGNAFAGKYDSVFCANQGTPEERYEAFENAVRVVYASTMNEDALAYRYNRGLVDKDEQMAILVQRVSGDYHAERFFPHLAGVGNSSNLYVWDQDVDMQAGMLRLVFGLGTRAVDRMVGDHARLVTLDLPTRIPPMHYEDRKKYTQRYVDVISLSNNQLQAEKVEQVLADDIRVDAGMFAEVDTAAYEAMRQMGMSGYTPYILDFSKLLKESTFPQTMRKILHVLSDIYEYPVDIEFTANFTTNGEYKVNLLQCRPLQTKGLGKLVEFPSIDECDSCFFSLRGNFMGGNVRLPVEYVIYIDPCAYASCNEQRKYAVARAIGGLNNRMKGSSVMLMGPGRWGTTTASLGVPVHFSEICHMAVLCEMASVEAGMVPELSYGSHFFQDLVETDIFYVAVFPDRDDVMFNLEHIKKHDNVLNEFAEQYEHLSDVIYIAKTDGMEIYSDIVSQKVLCR